MDFAFDAGDLDRRLRIERPAEDDSFDSAGSTGWEPVATVYAQVRDVLPSRSEKDQDGATTNTRPARVRIRYREDISSEMRLVLIRKRNGNWEAVRTLQIVSGPVELGRRVGLEMMAEDYKPAGGVA